MFMLDNADGLISSSACCIGVKDGKIRALLDAFTDEELLGAEVIDAEYVVFSLPKEEKKKIG